MIDNSRLNNNKGNRSKILSAALVFAFVFVLMFVLSLRTDINSVFSQNLQALYSAFSFDKAHNSVVLDNTYMGGVSFVSYIVFAIFRGKSIELIAKIMLMIMAFMRAVPAFVSTYLAGKYYGLSFKISAFVGILSAFSIPATGLAIGNETLLIGGIWILLLLVYLHECSDSRKTRVCLFVLICVLLALFPITDFKSVVLIPAFFGTYFVIKLAGHAGLREKLSVIAAFAAVCISVVVLYKIIFFVFYGNASFFYNVENSPAEYLVGITAGLKTLGISYTYIFAFLDVVFGNLWELCVLSLGCLALLVLSLKKANRNNMQTQLAAVVVLVAIVLNVLLVSISYMGKIDVWESSSDFFENYFSYYGESAYLYGLLVFFVISNAFNNEAYIMNPKRFTGSLLPVLILLAERILSLIICGSDRTNRFMQLFPVDYKAAQNVLTSGDNPGYTIAVIIVVTLISALLPYLFIKISRDTAMLSVVCLLVMSFYFEAVYTDNFSLKETYSYNAVSTCNSVNSVLNEAVITDLYVAESEETACLIKYSNPGLKVYCDVPDLNTEDFVIHSSGYDFTDDPSELEGWNTVRLDEDEVLVFKGEKYNSYFTELGCSIEDAERRADVEQLVSSCYQALLDRDADASGLLYASNLLCSNSISVYDYILSLTDNDEYRNVIKDYDDKAMDLFDAFPEGNYSRSEIRAWGQYVDSEARLNQLIGYLVTNSNTLEKYESFGIASGRDSFDFEGTIGLSYNTFMAKYNIKDLVRRSYRTCFGRGVDSEAFIFWCNAIESGEYDITVFYDALMASDEFVSSHNERQKIEVMYELYTQSSINPEMLRFFIQHPEDEERILQSTRIFSEICERCSMQ